MIRKLGLSLTCAGATVLGLLTTSVQAATFNLGTLIATGQDVTVGDLLFDDFSCTIAADSGLTTPNSCSQINVITQEPSSGAVGLTFQSGFFTGPDSFIDVLLSYTVTALDPLQSFSTVGLAFNGAVTGEEGFTNVVETIFDPSTNQVIGQGAVTAPPTNLDEEIVLSSEVQQIRVNKDILLVAGEDSTASVSFVSQTYELTSTTKEVDEPNPAIGLMMFGLCGFGLMMKRRQHQDI